MEKSQKVEGELEKIVDVAIDTIPSLREIRVFGSYNKGNWNPKKSDIDVYLESGDKSMSLYPVPFLPIVAYEGKKRKKIKDNFLGKLDGLESNFEFHCHYFKDLKRFPFDEFFVSSVKKGRLIYEDKNRTNMPYSDSGEINF